jgi:hypothetical protein
VLRDSLSVQTVSQFSGGLIQTFATGVSGLEGLFVERGLSHVMPVRRGAFTHSVLTHGMHGIDVGTSARPIIPTKLTQSDSSLKITNLSE